MKKSAKAILYLADGTYFEGYSIGTDGTTFGEICFNTGMTGYQEVFTDPSYTGQLLVATHPHIGNYGTLPSDEESNKIRISGFICKNFSDFFSRSELQSKSLQHYFEQHSLIGIEGIDTRSLVAHIRKKGAMNAVISTDLNDSNHLDKFINDYCPQMEGLELASKVSTLEPYFFEGNNGQHRVAVIDYGVKTNILRSLKKRDCEVKVFPAQICLNEVLAYQPHGILLSNGPGDPEPMNYAVTMVQELLKLSIPIFGICLGHQILALACGLSTFKMSFGHRGLNHPVLNIQKNLAEITSQNHGFAIDAETLNKNSDVVLTHTNLNDRSVEGILIKNKKIFSVQYHPESNPGPHDSRYLFDQFVEYMSS